MITKTVAIRSTGPFATDHIMGRIASYERDGWAIRLWHWHTRGVYIVFERENTIGVDGHT